LYKTIDLHAVIHPAWAAGLKTLLQSLGGRRARRPSPRRPAADDDDDDDDDCDRATAWEHLS
jgi:hypothetical protein